MVYDTELGLLREDWNTWRHIPIPVRSSLLPSFSIDFQDEIDTSQ